MRCERCEFGPPPDSEGFVDECPYYTEFGREFSDGSFGCRMNYQTLRKQQMEYEQMLGDEGEDQGIQMDFENRGWNLDDAIQDMKHMLGIYPQGRRKVYHRHGKAFYKPYRNYFYGNNRYMEYFSGVLGITKKIPPERANGLPYYSLTAHGLKYLGRHIKVIIHEEED